MIGCLSLASRSLLAALLLSGCAAGASGDAGSPPAAAVGEYVIGSGDSLSVFVYHAPELSIADLPVRPDGRISIPLIENIQAAGATPSQLGRTIETRLKQYVRDPQVTVIVRTFNGPFDQQIRVIGEAVEPVAIPYRSHMTLLDVMIATKGLTKFAAGNSAVLVRRGADGRLRKLHARLSDLVRDGDIGQNVEMQPGDTLIIPQTWF